MPRIGFAFNQKPELDPLLRPGEGDALPEEEPPSSRRDDGSRFSDSPTHPAAATAEASPSRAPDVFAEWDTPETVDAVERALAALGDVVRLEATDDFPERLRRARPDIVFNMAEGLHGVNREAHVPAICEFYGIPYSGSDPLTLSLCLDKARTKEILAHHGIPTAPFTVLRTPAELDALRTALVRGAPAPHAAHGLSFPLFVKPLHEGSSKGITERNYCRNIDELVAAVEFLLAHYAQPVLVEAFLPGAEFTCAVLGNGERATVLPLVGMNFGALPEGALAIYGFEAKWLWDSVERPLDIFECPARIDAALRRVIERTVLHTYRVLGCRDWSRIDVRLDAAGVPNVVEVNPLPGILPNPADNSCLPKAARAAGMSYDELIQRCLLLAAERQHVPLTAPSSRRAGADPRADARVAAER